MKIDLNIKEIKFLSDMLEYLENSRKMWNEDLEVRRSIKMKLKGLLKGEKK